MAIAAGFVLYVTRGTTFNPDELYWLYDTPHLDLERALEPYNGNLIVTTRLIYKALLEAFGAGYLPFRVLGISAIVATAAVFYVVAKRRIGAVPALAPTLILLFFGSAGTYAFAPIAFAALASITAGLGALLALEREDHVGDVTACGMTILSVITFSTGLAFLAGVAISVLIHPDRLRRTWIFAVPVILYGGWYLWSSDSSGSVSGSAAISNLLLVPSYAADALAAALAALTGLSYDFNEPVSFTTATNEIAWGRPLAAVAVVALVVRMRWGNLPRSLWVSLGIALAAWTLGAIAFEPGLREPTSSRYVYLGAIVVLLVATDAARSMRLSPSGLVVLFGACLLSLGANIELVRAHAAAFREYSIAARAEFGVLELARRATEIDLDPGPPVPRRYFQVTPPAGKYFDVTDRYGSPALPVSELAGQPEGVREDADRLLGDIYHLHLGRERLRALKSGCAVLRSGGADQPIRFELPPGGTSIRARAPDPVPLTVGRFASVPSIALGDLPPGDAVTLRIPRDDSPTPWRASVAAADSIELCRPSR
jgi:hypothetical protein